MLSVYIDFRSPASYLALAPTLQLAEEAQVALRWRPFVTREREMPANPQDPVVTESHHRVRAESRRATHAHYARLRGLPMHWPDVPGRSDLALGALAVIEGDPTAFLHAAFQAYWVHNRDLDDPATLAELLASVGAASLAGDVSRLRAALDDAQAAAEQAGVVEAPAYRIGEQLFIGREHLPWIRELLAGR